MNATILIRPAEPRDMPGLVRMMQRSWLVTWAPELPFEAVQAFAAVDPVRLHVAEEWPSFVVAIRGDVLLGMVQTRQAFVHALHVDPAHWNCGAGSRLLEEAERVIAERFPVAQLEVRSFNTRARAFYARRGWTEVRHYPGTECGSPVENVEMQKTL